MNNISFKYFAKHHSWLFLVVVLMPILCVGIYCALFWKCIDESIVATIVMGIISYIGTVAWGIFIYYKSWVDKEIQEYKNRPIIESKVLLSSKGSQSFRLYEKSEVEDSLNGSIMYHGLEQFNNTNIKYALIKITNYGISRLSDICIENVIIRRNCKIRHQESNSYIVSRNFPKTLSYKDNWELFVAIDESLIDTNENGIPEIIITLRFNNNFVDTYYNIVILQIVENGSYGQRSDIYNEEGYNKENTLRPLRGLSMCS